MTRQTSKRLKIKTQETQVSNILLANTALEFPVVVTSNLIKKGLVEKPKALMAKPPWQEPDGFTEHARGTYARTSRVCTQNSRPPYRRLLRRLHIARQKIFKDMLRHIILFL